MDTSLQRRFGEVNVYYGHADKFVSDVPVFYSFLSEKEKERANRFKHNTDYNCYVSAHALLRLELSKRLGINVISIDIDTYLYGKPFVTNLNLPFSLSRSKSRFAFVVGSSNQYLGLDLEETGKGIDFDGISGNYFNEDERKFISSLDTRDYQYRAFLEIWTRKEAFLKSIGLGINTDLTKVRVLEGENQITLEGVHFFPRIFKIFTYSGIPDGILSVATTGDGIPIFNEITSSPSSIQILSKNSSQ